MTPPTSKSPMDKPQEIWLSGSEHINLISDLLEPKEDSVRPTGKTTKLALKYAQLALHTPHNKIIIKDHSKAHEAHRRLQSLVCRVLEALNIDYEVGVIRVATEDLGSFTGKLITRKQHYIIARPKDGIKE